MCSASFEAVPQLHRRRQASVIGTIFCCVRCANRFDREIGGNPVLYDFGAAIHAAVPTCRDCGNVLEHIVENRRCRLCRLQREISRQILGEATRLARQRKVRAAQRAFGLPQTPLEIVD